MSKPTNDNPPVLGLFGDAEDWPEMVRDTFIDWYEIMYPEGYEEETPSYAYTS